MIEEKNWYQSKTIWGALVAVAASFSGSLGISIDPASQADMTEAILQLVTACGALIAVYGRLNATQVIA